MAAEVRVGVIGLGIGEKHVQEYLQLDGMRLVAVADTVLERAEKVAARHSLRPYQNGLDMLEHEDLEAVSICTPPRWHHDQVLAAAERGLHVLCEKPMAPSLEECDDMIAACHRAGTTLLLGYKKRSSPLFRFLKESQVQWGEPRIGQVRYQLGPVDKAWFWEAGDGGGPLIENTAHAFDMLRYLFGDVERVYAEGNNALAPPDCGRVPLRGELASAACTLRFRSGSIVTLAAGCGGIWGYDQSERWVLNYDALNVEASGPFDSPRVTRLMRRDGVSIEERSWADASGWSQQMAHFLACIRGEEQPRATGEDGKRALELGLAVKRSARTGQPVAIALVG
jgi:UDP-N-acetylglucosamine 3-dehydrogenase